MEQFPHLKFVQQLQGRPRLSGGGKPHPRSDYNKSNRQAHVDNWRQWTNSQMEQWKSELDVRNEQQLAPIEKDVIPIYIQVNPNLFTTQFDLHSFGIEIISEEDDGFIIGASLDNFKTLQEKIEGFLEAKHGSTLLADFWTIFQGNRDSWRPSHILSETLFEQWDTIDEERTYHLEVSIAFDKPIGKEPDISKRGGQKRWDRWLALSEERDLQLSARQSHFEQFIEYYGQITSSFVDLEDSFGCEVSITGKGLKDLVTTYQFVFDVSEIEEIIGVYGEESDFPDGDFQVVAPSDSAVVVGVIDSGIMENNKYIELAVNPTHSQSFLRNDISVADHVERGGHGTKVAGAILYPRGISGLPQPYQLPCFIRNLRILDGSNTLTHVYPAQLMQEIVEGNPDCEIFNLSVSSKAPCRLRHMSSWAAMLDKLSHEEGVLFVVAVGNLTRNTIKQFFLQGIPYPNYLGELLCRLANPAQSSFAISVGSINHAGFEDDDWKSIGNDGEISGYSRVGTGLWGHVKPDVVEYGGGIVISKDGTFRVKEHAETASELIRSTLHGGGVAGKDSSGTSFACPKVTHLAALLKQLYPNEDFNLIRALIIQGARLPGAHFTAPTTESIRHFGYGIPLLERVTKNTEHRITFYNTGELYAEQAHIYSLAIPEELYNPGNEYDILIEITLAYSAKVRRTRQKTNSYMSTWLDWRTSKRTESFDDFKEYALKQIDDEDTTYDKDARNQLPNYPWVINTRTDHGHIQDINRNNSSVQKDWAVVKSYELDKEIGIAVRSHKGWDRNHDKVQYAITVSIEILGQNIPIYDQIRVHNQEIEL